MQSNTAVLKINGKYAFTLNEAFAIRDAYFPGMEIEYLFAADAV